MGRIIILTVIFLSGKIWAKTCIPYPIETFHEDILSYTSPQKVSDACISYSLDQWNKIDRSQKKSYIANCENRLKPLKGNLPPCITPDYIQVSHKSLMIVTDCLGIDAKKLIPKIKGESGFFHNALFAGPKSYDAGIGQLTQSAIQDVQSVLSRYKKIIDSKSKNRACQILASKWDALTSIQGTSPSYRCEFLSWPLNPLKNTLWTGIFIKHLEELIAKELIFTSSYTLLRNAGLKNYKPTDLVSMLANLAYNSGSKSAASLLNQYLKTVGRKISLDDFNFKEDLSWINRTKNWKKIPISNLTFPGFVKIYMEVGHPGYLPDMMKQIYDYNNNLGQNTCTPSKIEGFLAL